MGRRPTGQAEKRWVQTAPADMATALDERARASGLTRNETVRRMLRWALAQPKVGEKIKGGSK